ncbi:hypothetical protein K438DRAFT_1991413 [Mycena galopus ATCC 62051]|nr:hypothetical protein K438DRAFT_1991413 [Mycena galopus ATCC 62051]
MGGVCMVMAGGPGVGGVCDDDAGGTGAIAAEVVRGRALSVFICREGERATNPRSALIHPALRGLHGRGAAMSMSISRQVVYVHSCSERDRVALLARSRVADLVGAEWAISVPNGEVLKDRNRADWARGLASLEESATSSVLAEGGQCFAHGIEVSENDGDVDLETLAPVATSNAHLRTSNPRMLVSPTSHARPPSSSAGPPTSNARTPPSNACLLLCTLAPPFELSPPQT